MSSRQNSMGIYPIYCRFDGGGISFNIWLRIRSAYGFNALSYIAYFLATIMFQPIIVFGIGIANILLLVMISVLKKDFTIGTDVYDPFTFFVVSFVIILALTWFRNEYEHLRQHDLSASEARYRGIFDASDDAILIHDMGQVIEVNAAFKRLLEMEFTEIQEKSKLLLEISDMTVAENVGRCGYRDERAFRRLFKKHCMVSPREYRGRFLKSQPVPRQYSESRK